ncbi:MAG: acyl carrier protein [Planctomycetota bacterium]|nr:MAG: acyl carrier protein [Planctomycetota bacterium]RLS93879.1 MAG: acyl carrier protein [Planctomycetota bacterium]
MTDTEIEAKVLQLVADQLGLARTEVASESEFDKLGDSLDKTELMMAFEDSFDVSISDETASTVRTVADAVKLIRVHMTAKQTEV